MALPAFSQVHYRKSPLRLVIAQVRFPVLLRFGEKAIVAELEGALRNEYPITTVEQQVNVQLGSEQPSIANATLYRFANVEASWSVVLGDTALTLESRVYTNIDDLISRFQRASTAAARAFAISASQRIGLRYINEFRFPQFDSLGSWRSQFNPNLGGRADAQFDEPAESMLQHFQVSRSDGTFSVRHGFLRGTTVLFPSEAVPPN